jgi:hypothetical protein
MCQSNTIAQRIKSLVRTHVYYFVYRYSGDSYCLNMTEVDPTLIPLPEDQPPQPRDIKLPPFWTTRRRAWFTFAESRFRLRGIEDEQQRFDHMLSALPAEIISQVIDLVDTLHAENQYEYFKAQLLDIHQLSDYEKFDRLTKMEPMGVGNRASSSTLCWSTAQ